MAIRSPETRRTVLALAMVLACLLFTVDSTIVNVALPHMQGSLQASQDQIAWVLTSYIVTSAIATAPAGWLAARYGLRRVLAIAVLGFTAGSMLCGFAATLEEMVAFRVLQGLCGASLVPLSQVALVQEYPPEQHGKVIALWTIGVLLGPIVGPTLGGYLTDELSWRWAFFINLPIGVLAYVGVVEGMDGEHADHSRPFDWTGFVLLSLALGALQLMLDRGQTLGWFDATEIAAEAWVAALAGYMFLVHTLTHEHPFVDPSLFRDRNLLAAITLMFVTGLSIMSPAVLIPSFLQSLQGYTPTQAGLLQAIRGVSSILAVVVASRLTGRVDARFIVAAGVIASTVGLVLTGGFTLDTPGVHVALVSFIQGLGTPLVFIPLSVLAYSTLRESQRAEAGAMLTLWRSVGSSIGISMAVAVLARSTQVNRAYLTEHFTAYDVERWAATGVDPGANTGTGLLVGLIERQAATIAYSNTFHVLAVVTVLVLPTVLLLQVGARDGRRQVEVKELA